MPRLACLLAAVCLSAGCVDKGGGTTAPKVYTRAEFKELVMGKTPDEVIAAVGKPERTSESPGAVLWTYRERTADPVTGKADWNAFVHFDKGRVSAVSY